MTIKSSLEAGDDVGRLVDFIAANDPVLAGEIEQELAQISAAIEFPAPWFLVERIRTAGGEGIPRSAIRHAL